MRYFCYGVALWLSLQAPAQGQAAPMLPPHHRSSTNFGNPTLSALTSSSGFIFAGTVTRVERLPAASPGGIASVRITLLVEQAVKGARVGSTFTFTEWAGLWSGGPRYRPGERLVLFLYPRSKAGLTSPVAGDWGRFEISGGSVVLGRQRAQALLGNSRLTSTHSVATASEVMHPADFMRLIKAAMTGEAR